MGGFMTYPSDVNDEQWELIKDHFSTGNYGKSRKHSQRILVNGVFYVIDFLRNPCVMWRDSYCKSMRLS